MPMPTLLPLLLIAGVAAVLGPRLHSQSVSGEQSPDADFAAPVRIQVGGEFLGTKRNYPSPVFHDVNGDGRHDIVIGDLGGSITVAIQREGDAIAFERDYPILGQNQQPLRFHNW